MNAAKIIEIEEGIRNLLVEKGDTEELQKFDDLVARRDAVFYYLIAPAVPGLFTQGSVNSLLAEMQQICEGFDAVQESLASEIIPTAPAPRV